MGRRWLLAGAAWLVTAALTTAVAIGAVNSLRRGLFGPSDEPPLTEAQVSAEAAAPPALPSAAGSPSASGSPPAAGPPSASGSPPAAASTPADTVTTRALSTPGGTITASCEGGRAKLVSWIPNSGYEADHVVRGPAATASLRFKPRSGGGAVRAQVTCPDGTPVLTLVDHD